MLLQEVILENFMSYEYARVPFKPGVNVICGPNGAGKSSLLLAISVALGQTYTERSKKLSDLIRWGKDQARITLILDNARKGKRRPVPKYNKDQIFLTRTLRKDGKYWFELENRAASKKDVERILNRLGVDPNNMLIIMHQNMVEQFTVLSPQEKLRMVEAAVGLASYRQNVLQAQKKLTRILSQEESINKLLESAEQTLNYWREQYDRYQEKKQLLTKRRFLERELAWTEVTKRENLLEKLENERNEKISVLNKIEGEIKVLNGQIKIERGELEKLKSERKRLFDERLNLEYEKAKSESTIALCEQLLKETSILEEAIENGKLKLQISLNEESPPSFKFLGSKNLKEIIESNHEQISKLRENIKESQTKLENLDEEIEKVNSQFLESKIKLAIFKYRKDILQSELKKLDGKIREAKSVLDEAVKKAEKTGPRVAVVRNVDEILDEIRVIDGHLAALSDVSEDVERMYESYSKLYLELKEKAKLVAENREKALGEVNTRMEAWRKVIQSLLDHVNFQYQKILAQTGATGEVRLTNGHDIEAAGLEILVGFKGGKPVPLDAYTQSGGERTTATISFLLALQQHVRSPFRAVDEYDVHMDPKNREVIAKTLVSAVRNLDVQYVIITPSQITFTEDVNLITVQNVEGKSIVRELHNAV